MKRTIPILLPVLLYLLMLSQDGNAQGRIQFGKSYVNITKGTTGGTIEPGDILEIRATIAVGDFATPNPVITNLRFNDTIPTNTKYVFGSLKILTNEGLAWRNLTDSNDADQGRYYQTVGVPRLRINMGSSFNGGGAAIVQPGTAPPNDANPTGTSGGRIETDGRPSFYGGVCIMSASYRIKVDSPLTYGTVISMYGGAFRYDSVTARIAPLPAYNIALTQNLGLCANAIGANAIIDNGGTFGTGITQNRTTSAIVPGYIFANVTNGQPNDGSYAIVNNLSPTGITNVNSLIPDTNSVATKINRVFRLWDIMGDHTAAAVPANGNLPVAPGVNGGYFVAINASYANNNAIQQTVGGLCPNTYYEFSAWFKNICRYCACDSTGDAPYRQPSPTSLYVPNAAYNGPDSSGVNPNLTFTIDGTDYYTSGTMRYTGQWIKKGFVYLTGPLQTGFTLTIRNNAAGGGGNDWAIDDVTLATCTPNLDLRPSPNVRACYGNQIDMFAIVNSFFPNYVNFRWEKSTNGGSTWTNTASGTMTYTHIGANYTDTVTYPSFLADSAVHNNLFRLRLASTPGNLNSATCSFLATTLITVLVDNCQWVLKTDFQSLTGQVINNQSNLQWLIANEDAGITYEVESSNDGVRFDKIGTVTGTGSESYQYTDPRTMSGPRYYRIKATDGHGVKYSRQLLLSNRLLEFGIRQLVNPFTDHISFELTSPDNAPVTISIFDSYGRMVKQSRETVYMGTNTMQVQGMAKLPAGIYMLQVQKQDQKIISRILKTDR